MTEKQFTLRDPEIDKDIESDEIAFKGEWITYGEIVDLLNEVTSQTTVIKGYQERNEKLFEENEQLKQELFESEFEYIMESWNDNPIRRDQKIELLKEEFKERFGRDFEYD